MENLPLPRVLVYQDEDCEMMTDYLAFQGFAVIPTTTANILMKARTEKYDLCIVDHYASAVPGDLKVLMALRRIDKHVPVIVMTSKSRHEFIIDAFNSGADDYIARPYNLDEVVCRIKALLKRCGIKTRGLEDVYRIGNYTFDVKEQELSIDDVRVRLTEKESRVLALLCAYKNELLPRKVIMQHVWSDDNYFNKRSLDVHMCALRNYLKTDSSVEIETKRGLGYTLKAPE